LLGLIEDIGALSQTLNEINDLVQENKLTFSAIVANGFEESVLYAARSVPGKDRVSSYEQQGRGLAQQSDRKSSQVPPRTIHDLWHNRSGPPLDQTATRMAPTE
jgi:hypothetical protein